MIHFITFLFVSILKSFKVTGGNTSDTYKFKYITIKGYYKVKGLLHKECIVHLFIKY